jgi:hypothetical protein
MSRGKKKNIFFISHSISVRFSDFAQKMKLQKSWALVGKSVTEISRDFFRFYIGATYKSRNLDNKNNKKKLMKQHQRRKKKLSGVFRYYIRPHHFEDTSLRRATAHLVDRY